MRRHVVTACNGTYVHFLICHLWSLAQHHTAEPLTISVLYTGIPETMLRRLSKIVPPQHTLHWIEIDKSLLLKLPPILRNVTAHYYRLLIPTILPKTASRAIYLDADTIALQSLYELFDIDLTGYPVAAVRDYLQDFRTAVSNWKQLGCDPDSWYFNSGVLVMDLTMWRSKNIAERAMQTCVENQQALLAQGKWPQYDQYGLNIVLRDQWVQLSTKWNYGAELKYTESVHVVHYIGNGKPHSSTCTPEFRNLFYHATDEAETIMSPVGGSGDT